MCLNRRINLGSKGWDEQCYFESDMNYLKRNPASLGVYVVLPQLIHLHETQESLVTIPREVSNRNNTPALLYTQRISHQNNENPAIKSNH